MAKILQVGLGRFGQVHLRTWRRLGADLLLCDTSEAALEPARRFACAAATDWRDLLDDADAVDVVTPAGAHAEIVEAALRAGKDVFCEKPLALASEAAYELAELADALGRILQVGHVFRFEPAAEEARLAVRSGRIGRVRYVLGRFMGFKRPRADGGVAISDAIHLVDVVSWILEKQPRRVSAVLRDTLGRGMDDAAFITLDYGFETAQVVAGYFPPERKRDLEIVGEEGSLACDFLAPRASDHDPVERELAHFLRCVETREAPRADGFAGAHAVAAIEAAERAGRERRMVPLGIRLPAYAT